MSIAIIFGGISMDDRAKRIYGLMQGTYDLSAVQIGDMPEAKIVENEFQSGKYCYTESEREMVARVKILDRLTGGKDDNDMDELVDTRYNIEEHLICKMYDYAIQFHTQDVLQDIFSLIKHHRMVADNVDELEVKMTYSGEADGLMAAAVLITKAELDDVEKMYNDYVAKQVSD